MADAPAVLVEESDDGAVHVTVVTVPARDYTILDTDLDRRVLPDLCSRILDIVRTDGDYTTAGITLAHISSSLGAMYRLDEISAVCDILCQFSLIDLVDANTAVYRSRKMP